MLLQKRSRKKDYTALYRIPYTYSFSNKGSRCKGGWNPGRNRPLYPARSTNVCVVSPYCRNQDFLSDTSVTKRCIHGSKLYLNKSTCCCFTNRLENSQFYFPRFVLEYIRLFHNDGTPLSGFLWRSLTRETMSEIIHCRHYKESGRDRKLPRLPVRGNHSSPPWMRCLWLRRRASPGALPFLNAREQKHTLSVSQNTLEYYWN